MKVGNYQKKVVSELNHELYQKAKLLIEGDEGDDDYVGGWHMGWQEVGKFIDWLEENYIIQKKE